MHVNVGGYDRIARLVLGPVLFVVGLAGYAGLVSLAVGPVPQALGSLLLVLVGLILAVTGAVRRCPLNAAVGLNTATSRRSGESTESPRDRDVR